LVNNHNGGRLRLIASRHDDDDDVLTYLPYSTAPQYLASEDCERRSSLASLVHCNVDAHHTVNAPLNTQMVTTSSWWRQLVIGMLCHCWSEQRLHCCHVLLGVKITLFEASATFLC